MTQNNNYRFNSQILFKAVLERKYAKLKKAGAIEDYEIQSILDDNRISVTIKPHTPRREIELKWTVDNSNESKKDIEGTGKDTP